MVKMWMLTMTTIMMPVMDKLKRNACGCQVLLRSVIMVLKISKNDNNDVQVIMMNATMTMMLTMTKTCSIKLSISPKERWLSTTGGFVGFTGFRTYIYFIKEDFEDNYDDGTYSDTLSLNCFCTFTLIGLILNLEIFLDEAHLSIFIPQLGITFTLIGLILRPP